MTENSCTEASGIDLEHGPDLYDEDILDAIQQIDGYLDISTEDFRIIYHLAWRHAVARVRRRKAQEPR